MINSRAIRYVYCLERRGVQPLFRKKQAGKFATADWWAEGEIRDVAGKNAVPGSLLHVPGTSYNSE